MPVVVHEILPNGNARAECDVCGEQIDNLRLDELPTWEAEHYAPGGRCEYQRLP